MKRLFLPVILVSLCFFSFSQVPNAFNYQAVVRNVSGEIIANQPVSFRISILEGSPQGETAYSETHTVSTNQFGLANLVIGKGENTSGIFDPGGWGVIDHFIKVEIKTEGGTTFLHMGTSQLLSVPYAFHAQTVANDQVDDADADPSNEIQTISLSETLLSLSKGGGNVTLPSGSGLWTGSGSNIYRTSGNVGIGTSNPLSLLSVGGDGALNAVIYGNATDGLYYGGHFFTDHFSGKAVSGEATSEQGTGVHGASSGANGWGVYGYASGSEGRGVYGFASGSSAFAGYFSGNVYMDKLVGIGTTVPETPLTVHTTTQFDPENFTGKQKGSVLLTLGNGTQGLNNYGPALSFSGINTGRRRAAIASVQTTSDPDQVGLAFFTHPSTAASNEVVSQQMVITHLGLVGMGKDDPTSKLDVYAEGNAIHGEGLGNYSEGVFGLATGSYSKGVIGKATGNFSIGVAGIGDEYDFLADGPGIDFGVNSSIRWKKNIAEINDPLEKLTKIRGVYFDWDEEHGGKHDVGCIAEEVGEILPEIVVFAENGIYADAMDYSKLTPLLIEVCKALKKELDDMNNELSGLKQQMIKN